MPTPAPDLRHLPLVPLGSRDPAVARRAPSPRRDTRWVTLVVTLIATRPLAAAPAVGAITAAVDDVRDDDAATDADADLSSPCDHDDRHPDRTAVVVDYAGLGELGRRQVDLEALSQALATRLAAEGFVVVPAAPCDVRIAMSLREGSLLIEASAPRKLATARLPVLDVPAELLRDEVVGKVVADVRAVETRKVRPTPAPAEPIAVAALEPVELAVPIELATAPSPATAPGAAASWRVALSPNFTAAPRGPGALLLLSLARGLPGGFAATVDFGHGVGGELGRSWLATLGGAARVVDRARVTVDVGVTAGLIFRPDGPATATADLMTSVPITATRWLGGGLGLALRLAPGLAGGARLELGAGLVLAR